MRVLPKKSLSQPQSLEPQQHADERLFIRPEFDIPSVPLDLTMIDDDTLMELFAKAVAWQNFAASLSVESEVREADAEQSLATYEAAVMIRTWTGAKEDRVTISRAQRDADPTVQAAQTTLGTIKAARKRAQTVRDNAERIASLLSRELTRRVGRDPVDRRTARWQP